MDSLQRTAALGQLTELADDLDVRLSQERLQQFETYLDTLLFWRQRLSLTTADTAPKIIQHHLMDSLYVTPHIPDGARVADIGSGAGFPGIVLAITCPTARITLIESRRKRANFLRTVIRETRLDNADVAEDRAETIGSQRYDVSVSRALGSLDRFLKLSAALLTRSGLAIAMKGPRNDPEPVTPGFSDPSVVDYALPGGVKRRLLLFRATPSGAVSRETP